MFKKVKWSKYKPFELNTQPQLDKLLKLINLVFPDVQLVPNKQEQEMGLITITDGRDQETHTINDLVYHKLPYLIFSNNYQFVRGFRNNMSQGMDPIQMLSNLTERYYKTIKKQKNFHL